VNNGATTALIFKAGGEVIGRESLPHIVEGGCYHGPGRFGQGFPRWSSIAIVLLILALVAIGVLSRYH
jgi:hypothetical protein